MTKDCLTMGWSSDREYFVTSEDLHSLQELRQIDGYIGSLVESKYGISYLPTNVLKKVFRRIKFELVRIGSLIFSGLFKRFSRFWRKQVSNKLLYRGPQFIEVPETQLEIVSLTVPLEELRKRLTTTKASHWILIKPHSKLLKSGVAALLEATKVPKKLLHYGDSSSPDGLVDRRPWNSKLLQRQIDISGPVIMTSTSFLRQVFDNSVNIELLPFQLFLSAKESDINQVPEVLALGSLWDAFNLENQKKATELVEKDLANFKVSAHVAQGKFGQRVITYKRTNKGKVSIIIPTRGTQVDGQALVLHAIRTVIEKTVYPDYEIIVVADQDTPQHVIDELESLVGERLLLVRWKEKFNFSKKMNLGSVVSTGEFLLFLNDDIELVSPKWIEEMTSLIGIDGIGYVGALLFFEDGSIQHAGHFYESGAGHIAFKQPFRPQDPRQLYAYDRKVSGVTAACALVSRQLFFECGGFSELFPGNYNDVDFSLKISELGYEIAVASQARLYHFESKSRDAIVSRSEILALHKRWFQRIQTDPWYRGI